VMTVIAVVAFASQPAVGANYIVSNLNDAGAGSLRQAILDANTSLGADTISFQPGLSGTIQLTSGEIAITDSVEIQGPGARQLAVTSTARIFNIGDPKLISALISGLTLTGANASGIGGAIFISKDQNVTLQFVTLAGNHASGEDGAIYNAGAVLRIENSTLSGNTANKAGAIYHIGWRLDLINSTVSGNTATDSVGGIKLEWYYASIINSTIVGNSAGFSQGGILAGSSSSGNVLDLVSDIVANNTDSTGSSDLARFNGVVNATNSLFKQNLVAGTINGTDTGNQIGVDPGLLPLANYGGPTDTHALTAVSLAVDRGSNPLGLANDQRGPGYQRQFGSATDVGAFELQPTAAVPLLSPLGLAAFVLGLLFVGVLVSRRRRRQLA